MAVSKIPMPHEINNTNPEYTFVTASIDVTTYNGGWIYLSYKNTQLTITNCAGVWISPNGSSNSTYTCFDRVMINSSGQWRARCTDNEGNPLADVTRTVRILAYVSRSIL